MTVILIIAQCTDYSLNGLYGSDSHVLCGTYGRLWQIQAKLNAV